MRYYFVRLAVLMGFVLTAVAVPALAERRLALSVGIDKYDNLPASAQLKKAVSDARAIGAALAELGFDTKVEENLTLDAFNDAWASFLNRLKPGDTAAFFFAGHGVQVHGANYLVPRSVPKVEEGKEKVLIGASIRFIDLMKELTDRGALVSLYILDACRESPFPVNTHGRIVGGGARGLRREDAVVKGSFILYSAGYGEQALDRLSEGDRDANSPYTRTLIPILKTPGLSLPEIARRVRAEVLALTHKQTPAYYDEVVGDFMLKPGPVSEVKPGAPAPVASAAIETARICREVEGMSNPVLLAVLARQHKGTPAGECVAARLVQLAVVAPPTLPKTVGVVAAFDPRCAPAPLTAAEERALKPKDSFKECAECPEMVVVPAGSFAMGSPESEKDRNSNEGPQHRVTIARPFAAGKFEVTFAEWNACVADGACTHTAHDGMAGATGWGRGKRPVLNVSWNDVTRQYLPWLNRRTGRSYRLLTEAEWEYAARGGSKTRYAFGDAIDAAQARFRERDEPIKGTVIVGTFPANAFGLFEMHGNVTEWVHDCWHANYSGAPSDGSAWVTGNCSKRSRRGGSWGDPKAYLRSAYRSLDSTTDQRLDYVGFRVGRTLDPDLGELSAK